jgi:hypothetical protein
MTRPSLKPKLVRFKDYPEFQPNLTPAQVLWKGAFGGVYFDPTFKGSSPDELPKEWVKGLAPDRWKRESADYDKNVNLYKVKAGAKQSEWEEKGWIHPQDPRGWFQWYCRFYLGRRTPDDGRQVKRWLGVAGPRGRFRINLIRRCKRAGKSFDDVSVSPVIRQTLLHWAYELVEGDFNRFPIVRSL